MNNDNFREHNNNRFKPTEPVIDSIPDADVISIETIVNMLVKKKICTADELFMLEGRIQDQNRNKKKNNFVSTDSVDSAGSGSGLKKLMGKRRWTRKIGAALFGWKWKKVKKSPSL